MMRLWAMMLALAASSAGAQATSDASGAHVRGIDKITGEIYDLVIDAGQTAQLDRIQITLSACRYPVGNPAGDAYAFIEVTDATADDVLFAGWMMASSPALSAMEHPRYDIWVIRCTTS